MDPTRRQAGSMNRASVWRANCSAPRAAATCRALQVSSVESYCGLSNSMVLGFQLHQRRNGKRGRTAEGPWCEHAWRAAIVVAYRARHRCAARRLTDRIKDILHSVDGAQCRAFLESLGASFDTRLASTGQRQENRPQLQEALRNGRLNGLSSLFEARKQEILAARKTETGAAERRFVPRRHAS